MRFNPSRVQNASRAAKCFKCCRTLRNASRAAKCFETLQELQSASKRFKALQTPSKPKMPAWLEVIASAARMDCPAMQRALPDQAMRLVSLQLLQQCQLKQQQCHPPLVTLKSSCQSHNAPTTSLISAILPSAQASLKVCCCCDFSSLCPSLSSQWPGAADALPE